jgi:hypothetical protein
MFNILSLQAMATYTTASNLISTASVRCGGNSWSTLSWGCYSKLI